MNEISRKGHRQRVKESYLNNFLNGMPDHNILELILFYAIPQKDVKPIAYALINRFGSLENVLKADIKDLTQVDGIGEHAAILLSLFNNVSLRVNQNIAKEKLETYEKMEEYAARMISEYKNEVFLIVSFDNNRNVTNAEIIEGGTVNAVTISKKHVAEVAIRNNASAILISHNHPGGSPKPSAKDINMTRELGIFLRQIGVKLCDHVIVGEGGKTQSLRGDLEYSIYFDDF